MFYDSIRIKNLYLVVGLARSGNHLFISWLLSALKFKNIIFFNNMKSYEFYPQNDEMFNEIEIKKTIIQYRAITQDDKSFKFDKKLVSKLPKKEYVKNFLDQKIDEIDCLIISFENQKSTIFNLIEKKFKRVDTFYKILIIRDLLNLTSSKIETKNLNKYNYYDMLDVTDIWLEHNKQTVTDIVFNYNNFLCDIDYQKCLCKKLDIEYNNTFITTNKFGRTRGSSFKKEVEEIYDYLLRFTKFLNHPLIKKILNNKEIVDIICSKYNICIEKDNIFLCSNVKRSIEETIKKLK